MSDDHDPRLVGYREFDQRVRPLELKVAVIEASLSDIPRRQTDVESAVSSLRAQQAEVLAILRDLKSERDATNARQDDPVHGLTAAVHRLLDERERDRATPQETTLRDMAAKAWDVAKVIAVALVVALAGKEALAVIG